MYIYIYIYKDCFTTSCFTGVHTNIIITAIILLVSTLRETEHHVSRTANTSFIDMIINDKQLLSFTLILLLLSLLLLLLLFLVVVVVV